MKNVNSQKTINKAVFTFAVAGILSLPIGSVSVLHAAEINASQPTQNTSSALPVLTEVSDLLAAKQTTSDKKAAPADITPVSVKDDKNTNATPSSSTNTTPDTTSNTPVASTTPDDTVNPAANPSIDVPVTDPGIVGISLMPTDESANNGSTSPVLFTGSTTPAAISSVDSGLTKTLSTQHAISSKIQKALKAQNPIETLAPQVANINYFAGLGSEESYKPTENYAFKGLSPATTDAFVALAAFCALVGAGMMIQYSRSAKYTSTPNFVSETV